MLAKVRAHTWVEMELWGCWCSEEGGKVWGRVPVRESEFGSFPVAG